MKWRQLIQPFKGGNQARCHIGYYGKSRSHIGCPALRPRLLISPRIFSITTMIFCQYQNLHTTDQTHFMKWRQLIQPFKGRNQARSHIGYYALGPRLLVSPRIFFDNDHDILAALGFPSQNSRKKREAFEIQVIMPMVSIFCLIIGQLTISLATTNIGSSH